MKKLVITSTLALLTTVWSMVGAQEYPEEYLGLPGDNLNLYATMKLFQESETLESFEKNLNDENSRINNLDLNGDNYIDYIMVIDYVDGDVHSIVLRAALNKDETQDVAVFTVQRLGDGSVQVQLVGDEALYGRNYIIEPIYADSGETPNPGYIGNSGNNSNVAVVRTTTYEVAAWPVVRYIYLPTYVSWHSSWYWDYYPSYWNPWRPFYWHTYYGYHYNYHNHYYGHYRAWNYNRCNNYNNFYYSNIRTHSSNVRARISNGNYRNTYSRPDLRKDGEALYSRTNSGQNARSRDNGSVDGRRGNNTKSGVERSSGTNVTRRNTDSSVTRGTENSRKSTTVAGSRNTENNSVRKASEVSRRVEKNTPARISGSSKAERGTDISRKSAEVTNNRAVKSSSVRQNKENAPRSSGNVSNRNVTKTQEAPRSVGSRSSSGQSQTKSAVSSRSSSGQSKSAVSSRSSGNQSRSSVSSGNSGSSSRSSGSRSSSGSSSSGSSGRR